MKKNILRIFILLIMGTATVNAQSQAQIFNEIDERVYLHVNTTTFLTGETLLYSFYNLKKSAETTSEISKIGYVQILDPMGNILETQKVALESGRGQGDFFISSNMDTGEYKVIAYTKWMLNETPDAFYQIKIAVINPFKAPDASMIVESDSTTQKTVVPSTKNISDVQDLSVIGLQKEVYAPREKVGLNIEELPMGTYSVSVRKTDELEFHSPSTVKNFSDLKNSKTVNANDKNILPELRGEIISGKITSKNDESVDNKTIALSIPGVSFTLHFVNTRSDGSFMFTLDKVPGKSELIVQVFDENKENYELELDQHTAQNTFFSFENNLQLNRDLKEAIEQRSTAMQIENAFYQNRKDSISGFGKKKAFYSPIAVEYKLDDYTRFPTVAETLIEIVPDVYFNRKNGIYTIDIRDHNNSDRAIFGKTLVLVDGLVLQDVNELFAFSANDIESIEVIYEGYVYGPKVFNGLVNFKTKKQNFNSEAKGDYLLKTEIVRPDAEKIYFQPDYSAENQKRIPDYRYQLLWLPKMMLGTEKKEINFYTSDVEGEFEIAIEGFSENGKPISVRKTFSVK
ncbi:MAG TPA: hypothetical protein VFM70_01425 [Salinimicrobium sp.]|nr:hypothetical protein [Salinimicrobium sp.]